MRAYVRTHLHAYVHTYVRTYLPTYLTYLPTYLHIYLPTYLPTWIRSIHFLGKPIVLTSDLTWFALVRDSDQFHNPDQFHNSDQFHPRNSDQIHNSEQFHSPPGANLCRLGPNLGQVGATWAQLGANMGRLGANLGPILSFGAQIKMGPKSSAKSLPKGPNGPQMTGVCLVPFGPGSFYSVGNHWGR